jgi:hypothetical protein
MTKRGSRKARKKGWRRRLALVVLLGVGLAAGFGWRAWRREARLADLERTRDALRAELASLRARDAITGSAPEGALLVGVPERAGAEILRHLVSGFLRQVEVEVRDLRVRKSGAVRVKPLIGRMTAGTYALDLRIQEVEGVLEPGVPKVRYEGGRVGVELPVRVARGEGRATLRFRWDSRGVAGAVCGDFAARIPVRGTVAPRTYPVRGVLEMTLAGDAIVATPSFPDLEVRLKIEPARESWEALDRVLGQRGFQCRAALRAADVPGLVRRLLDQGLKVKVPPRILRPLRFPAGLQREVTLGETTHELRVAPRQLLVSPRVVWYAADVSPREGRRAARAGR